MIFFIAAVVFMYVGRKIGWALSKSILYTAPPVTAGVVGAIWGVGVSLCIYIYNDNTFDIKPWCGISRAYDVNNKT